MSMMLETGLLIKRHFHNLTDNTIVMTKQLLIYGDRATVDSWTCHLVKVKYIKRLAWGIFIKAGMPTPSLEQIVRAKAKAFGHRIRENAEEFAAKINLIKRREDGTGSVWFATDGHTTSFWVDKIRVTLRGECSRKFLLKNNKAGDTLRALWVVGEEDCSEELIEKTVSNLTVDESYRLKKLRPWMPGWLARSFSLAISNIKRSDIFQLINWSDDPDYLRSIPGLPALQF